MWSASCPFVIFGWCWTRVAELRVKLPFMIERHYGQRQIAEGFFTEPIEDWWEPWMKQADEILDDEELINTVYEALRRRYPQSATRGRIGTPAEIVIRLMVLKHVRGWSYETLEREVRANMVYRMFTRIGAEKVPDAKTMGRLGQALGPEVVEAVHNVWLESLVRRRLFEGESFASIRQSSRPISIIRPTAVCWETGFGF